MSRSNEPRNPFSPGLLILSLLALGGLALIWSSLALSTPAMAAPAGQVMIYTPTPQPDGRIIYIVKENDTLLSISLLSGVDLDTLRGLNNLTNDIIFPNQELLLGLAGPEEITPTPGPSPTPTQVLPTATPKPGSGNLCVLLYLDANGDGFRQDDENSIPGGAISVSNRSGSVSLTTDTLPGTEPECFEKVPEGDYNVSVAVPSGYNPTTITSLAFTLMPGDQAYLDFGAQESSATVAEAPAPAASGKSPLLGLIGGSLLLLGVGLAVFAGKLMRTR